MTKKEQIVNLKRSVSYVKSDLIRLADKIRAVSVKEAERLDRIIYKLEHWQNS